MEPGADRRANNRTTEAFFIADLSDVEMDCSDSILRARQCQASSLSREGTLRATNSDDAIQGADRSVVVS